MPAGALNRRLVHMQRIEFYDLITRHSFCLFHSSTEIQFFNLFSSTLFLIVAKNETTKAFSAVLV